ncbi:MAG: hypothetical protein JW990_10145 [Thermoleophilia bacterium]|nr:hypothetical protein [Thermoleophilia bacterium]
MQGRTTPARVAAVLLLMAGMSAACCTSGGLGEAAQAYPAGPSASAALTPAVTSGAFTPKPSNGGPLAGFTIADRELTEFHRINYDTAHADVALDVNGDEVLVMQNSRTDYVDLLPLAASTTPTTESGAGYLGTGHLPLLRLFYDSGSPIGFEGGVHISGNAPGYALISTHQEPDGPDKNWLDRSIVLVRLDPSAPQVYYVAKIHNVTQEYWEETHATISNDGHTVVWAANFGVDVGEESPYLLRLDLP